MVLTARNKAMFGLSFKILIGKEKLPLSLLSPSITFGVERKEVELALQTRSANLGDVSCFAVVALTACADHGLDLREGAPLTPPEGSESDLDGAGR